MNLRLDPFERTGLSGSLELFNWFAYEFWRFVFVQQEVAKVGETSIEFPPMQKGASFNLEAVKRRDTSRRPRGTHLSKQFRRIGTSGPGAHHLPGRSAHGACRDSYQHNDAVRLSAHDDRRVDKRACRQGGPVLVGSRHRNQRQWSFQWTVRRTSFQPVVFQVRSGQQQQRLADPHRKSLN